MFHYMCLLGYSNVVKHMIGKMQTSELNLLDMNTRTALFYAVESGQEEYAFITSAPNSMRLTVLGSIARELLQAGATFHTKDTRGETIQDMAMRFGYINIVHVINEFKEKKERTATISKLGTRHPLVALKR